ncbi:MAG: trypsin-like serine protease [Gammaproteobacteria bacterium]|nr:trypsin-like serine protease [Gammaproteobacteria bacterium]
MPYLKGLCFVFICSIHLAQADTQTSPRVVGGTDAQAGDWPWMVALVVTGSTPVSGQFCGGSLISPSWVMTAAHCVSSPAITDFVVYAGAYNLVSSPGTHSAVESIHVHPDYHAPNLDYDIALIKLSSPITHITPVQLVSPQQMSAFSAGQLTTVIGFGDTSSLLYNFPDTLQAAINPLVSNQTCNINYHGIVSDNMLCAGYAAGGSGACVGDSGGPLVVQQAGSWYQIGIVSWGSTNGCAIADYYSVYTRVSKFTSWIYGVLPGLAATEAIDFSYAVAGQRITRSVSVVNNDTTDYNISNITLISATDAFTIVAENCTQTSLAAGNSCDIDVSFLPLVAAKYSASIEINTDAISFPVFNTQLAGGAIDASDFDTDVGSPGLVWGSAGNANWSAQSVTSTEGSTALISPLLNNNQSSALVAHLNLTVNDIITFDWKVSSEDSYDYLELWLDGQLINRISGITDWSQYTLSLSAGEHTIHWHYTKDYSISSGQDRGWIDNIALASSANNNPLTSAINIYGLLLILAIPLLRRSQKITLIKS